MRKKNDEQIDEAIETEQTTETEQTIDKEDARCITREQVNELTNTLKRIQAEFENYKKRVDKENVQLIKNSNAILIKDILPVMDSFELALKENNVDNPEVHKYRQGLEMIYTQLFSTLKEQGLRIIDTTGKKFDPYKHEVLLVKETDKEDDTILEEFQKGYMLNDTVLRHSKVMISKKHKE